MENKIFLAFDYGITKIGVACGQTITNSAQALTILKAVQGIPNWNEIEKLIEKWRPSALVVGKPLNMDGSESEMSKRATKFANRLNARFRIKIFMQDERLSSFEAKQNIQNNKQKIDDFAAAIILTDFLQQNKG